MIYGLRELTPFVQAVIPPEKPLASTFSKEMYIGKLMKPIIEAQSIVNKIFIDSTYNPPRESRFRIRHSELSDPRVVKAVQDFFTSHSVDVSHEVLMLNEGRTSEITVKASEFAKNQFRVHTQAQLQADLDAYLFKAVYEGNKPEIAYALEKGRKINALGPFGRTPVFFIRNDVSIIELLHSKKADFNIEDDNGISVLDVAKVFSPYNQGVFVKSLEEKGAKQGSGISKKI